MLRPRSIVAILATALGLTTVTARDAGDIPFDEQGYVGLRLRDIPGDHAVASWILPGPMEGRGLTCAGFDIARPDLVVAVDGRRMDADAFRDYVHARRPGETIRIAYRKSNARGGRIPKDVDHAETVHEIVVTVAARGDWSGTIGRPRSSAVETRFDTPPLLAPDDPANVLGGAINAHGLAAPLATLRGVFVEWRDDAPDHHELSRVRAPFAAAIPASGAGDADHGPDARRAGRPRRHRGAHRGREPGRAGVCAGRARRGRHRRRAASGRRGRRAHGNVRLVAPGARSPLAGRSVRTRLRGVPSRARRNLLSRGRGNPRTSRRDPRVHGRRLRRTASCARRGRAALRARRRGPPRRAAARPAGGAGRRGDRRRHRGARPRRGHRLGRDRGRRPEPVRHGEVGGGDRRGRRRRLPRERPAARGPRDHRTRRRRRLHGHAGPGPRRRAARRLVHRRPRRGRPVRGGAPVLRRRLLRYVVASRPRRRGRAHGDRVVKGAACYGAGMLFDLGPGADVYSGAFLCQGVGGPRGFGCIVDEGGRDLYRVNGPTPSAYGTAAVYQSFSQGMGFGYRHYTAGGIGVISDLGGHDRYEAGEFAQGGAYYFGLGILHDAAGRDLYYGNRYGQGFGVHQAHGALVDDGGDDVYWSMTAASQGAAWDIGAGLLLDRAGDDTYQCDGLGQGAASQQGIALLVDLAGRDRYAARGGATQGQSGANDYHFGETGAYSFSVLLDLGGADDTYSRGRANDATTVTGRANADAPASSSLHGLVIDR